jgi:hypothetical protein
LGHSALKRKEVDIFTVKRTETGHWRNVDTVKKKIVKGKVRT